MLPKVRKEQLQEPEETDQIVRVTQNIAASSSKKQMTLGVFLDLEKAYAMVWREGIIAKLSELGIWGKCNVGSTTSCRIGQWKLKSERLSRQRSKPFVVHRDA